MLGEGERQGTACRIKSLPEALVIAAQLAKQSWGLPLVLKARFPADGTTGGGQLLRQNPNILRVMSHCT